MVLQDALKSTIDLEQVVFPFQGNPPLSWHLSSRDIAAIRDTIAKPEFHQQHIQPVLDWATVARP